MVEAVPLKTRKMVIHDSVVSRLTEALETAKKGELVSIAIAGANLDGSLFCSWSETDDVGRLLGAISRIGHRLNDATESTVVEVDDDEGN